MRDKTCCFTGHRKIPPAQYRSIAKRLEKTVKKLIFEGFTCFEAGGALGFDTMAAQVVIKLRKKYPHVKLLLALPCLSQTQGWSENDKEIYEQIKTQADEVIYTSQEYTKDCMFKRNRYLVDTSSICVCYLTEDKGGTAYTIQYARERGISVINIANNQNFKFK